MDRRGVTLIELLIVIIIISILAMFAVPAMDPLPEMRLRMAARKIQSDVRFAQSLAHSLQQRTRIAFDTVSDTYTVYIEDGGWNIADSPFTRENFTVQLNQDEFSGVDITSVTFTGSDLVFDQWGDPFVNGGSSSLVGSGSVVLNGTLNVRVRQNTGRVDIQ